MRYYTLSLTFIFLSLITILISFYYVALIKPVEKEIAVINLQINTLRDKIKINELEYSAHTHSDYLTELENVYLFDKYKEGNNLNIVGINNFSLKNLDKVIKVVSK
tara:strand:- start:346 stop:663 length:318 start_codon:yes stop_codon:yes gene_type:complete